MSTAEPEPILLPVDDAESRYANHCDVWDTPHDVVMDLYTLGQRDEAEDARVATGVVRVRLPRTMLMPMLQALNNALGPLAG